MLIGAAAMIGMSSAASAQETPIAQSQASQGAPTDATPTKALPDATAAASAQPNAVAEVVVTGSLIRQPNVTATSPLTTVSSQEFKLQGATNVEDVLNTLPSVVASQSEGVGNGATGTSTVDLRGLGSNRNLVLIDGKRVGSSDPFDSGAVDLNLIPAALIQRVDVVSGGGSSIYGSDAISGVVNFIMQHDFQGLRIDGNFSDFEHGNGSSAAQAATTAAGYNTPNGSFTAGAREDVTMILGANSPDQKGNVTAYIGYRHIDPVSEGKYDYGACPLAESGSGFACSGSGTTSSARFITATADTYLDPKTGGLRDYNSATDAFNYQPYEQYQREDTRYTGGFFAHYQVNPKMDVYSDFMFMDDTSTAQLAPSGLFGQTFTVPCSNSDLTSAELSAFCGGSTAGSFTANISRRDVEAGPREEILKHQEFREVIGARGDLDSVWHYDVSAQYFQATMSDEQTGDVSLSKAQAALSGCDSAYTNLSITTGCTPLNIFSPGGVTQSAINYIDTDAFYSSMTTQQVVQATINGDLGKYGITSPWATDGVSVALGTSYRRESLSFTPDEEYQSGDLAGSSTEAPVSGSYDVYELFGEMRIPLVQDKPFIKDLSIDGAYRFSDYSTVGSTQTYSVEGNYSPTRDIRFRVTWNRAERAPNITELFDPQVVSIGAFASDPCAGAVVASTGVLASGYTAAQCANTGVTAAEYGHVTANTASQYNGLSGGNPDLQPEVANTYTGGIVFTPRFIPNLSVSLDYFNIFISGVIESISAQNTIDNCATTGSSYYCSLVNRGTNGTLWLGTTGYVSELLVNAGSLQTSGADLQVDYRWKIPQFAGRDWGRLNFNLDGTYTATYIAENEPGSGDKYNCAGFYGDTCGTPMPTWRHNLRATWATPWNFELSALWRYIGSVRSDGYIANVGDTVYAADGKLPSVSYLDLTGSYKFQDRYTIRVGVKNLMDKDPPIVGLDSAASTYGTANGNVYTGTYDVLGRQIFVGLTADF